MARVVAAAFGRRLVRPARHAGTTVADVTDPANPVEIGFYEAGSPHALTWSSYWHNGFIYANDIARGFDVFKLTHPAVRGAAKLRRDNPQTQVVQNPIGDEPRLGRRAARKPLDPRDVTLRYVFRLTSVVLADNRVRSLPHE